jgi:hypothetical protein
MLTAEQVLPFISSEDVIVRDHAVKYFADFAGENSPLTSDICWSAINRVGLNRDTTNLIGLLAKTEPNNASTDSLLGALVTSADFAVRKALFEALGEIDLEQLKLHRARIFGRADLPNDVRFCLLDRLDLELTPVGSIWWRFEEHAARSNELYWDKIDHSTTSRLVEALARHREFSASRAMAILDDPNSKDSVLEIFAIDLLSKLQHRPALEILLNRFAESEPDDDVLHEALQDALPRVGGFDLLAPLEEMFLEHPWEFQLYAVEALARLRHSDAEAALFRLYKNPRSEDSFEELATALLNLCTDIALPDIARMVVSGDHESGVYELDLDLVACSLMCGFDFPELAAMREEVVARDTEFRRQLASGDFEGKLIDDLDDDLSEDDYEDDDDYDEYDDDEMDSFYPEVPAEFNDRMPEPPRSIVNQTPKVGRNDPCPCGSGKKYKKCCLNK